MKKKLVAFAVTAAMVVTSAVPVFAQTWGKPADPVQVGNVITIKESTPRTDMADTITESGISFETVIDLNKNLGTGANFTLNFVDKDQNPIACDPLYIIPSGNTANIYFNSSTSANVMGIVTLQWKVSTAGIEVVIIQNGYDEEPVMTLEWALPTGAVALTDLTVNPDGSNPVVMYEVAPEYVTGVEVIKANKDKQPINEKGEVLKNGEEPVVATQPVEGEYYLVNSITLNDGTVIEADEVEKYATFTWKAEKADGTVVYTKSTNDRNVTGTFWGIADTKKFDGCYITLEVAAKKDAGVFGTVVWGDEADPLAIADRISGNNRYETAYAVAEKLKSAYATNGKFNAIVVANGDTYCDALAGTALATAKKAPIILVNDKNEAAAIDYVKENMIYNGTVYILGGEGVVSADFAKAVDKYNVKRLGGDDRYATNIAILEEIGAGTKSQIVIVSGTDFADALSAAATKIPVMLAGDQLSVEQKALLTEIGYKEVFVVGGTGAVNTVVAEQAALYGDSDRVAERIAGANRYETSTKVALRFFGAADNMVLATGNDFADALTGGVLAAEEGYPILLVNEYNTQQANDYVNYDNTVSDGFVVIGGQGAISNELVQKVAAQKIA